MYKQRDLLSVVYVPLSVWCPRDKSKIVRRPCGIVKGRVGMLSGLQQSFTQNQHYQKYSKITEISIRKLRVL